MARKKYIDDKNWCCYLNNIYKNQCSNNLKYSKSHNLGITSETTDFRRLHTTIRRNKEFRQALNDKLELFEDDS